MPYQNMVALFGKALKMDLSKLQKPKAVPEAIGDKWIALGYFDTLQFYELPVDGTSSWIQSMWAHNVQCSATLTGDFYYHPLHLIASITDEDQMLYQEFWEAEDCPYIFLTMVQAADPSRLWEISDKSVIQYLDDLLGMQPNKKDLRHVFYRTVELSDLVVLWRSNEICKILAGMQSLYQKAAIGDLNTFPAIQFAFLDSFIPQNISNSQKRKIFVSIQYTVKDPDKANSFFSNVLPAESPAFFTTGVEDIRVVNQEVTTDDLLVHLKRTLLNSENRTLFDQAFSESATQIGIPDNRCSEPLCRNTSLEQECITLLDRFQAIRNRLKTDKSNQQFDWSWIKAVSNLLNALVDMSRNWVMDGFCYLMLDAAKLFCSEIKKTTSDDGTALTARQMEDIQRFVRGWGTLMEQATKMDGRFLQMPGFSPALCEIPAKLLEFYLAFTRKIISIIQAGDSEKIEGERKISLLFVPKICRRVKVNSIFKEDSYHNHLLYVDIPLDQLYSPGEILCALSHEVAHFAGETWRCREVRKFELLYTLSQEFATYLRVNTATPVSIIYVHLKDSCNVDGLIAQDILQNAYECMLEIAAQDMGLLLEKFKSDIVDEADTLVLGQINDLRSESILLARQFIMKKSYMESAAKNLKYLFQECYADLNMILLLHLSVKDYIKMAGNELKYLSWEGNPCSDSRYYVIVQRWVVLLKATSIWNGGIFPIESYEVEEFDECLKRFYNDIRCLMTADASPNYLKNKVSPDCCYYFTRETLRHITSYIEHCASVIRENVSNDALKHMHSALCYFSDGSMSNRCCFDELIDWNRKDLLGISVESRRIEQNQKK